MQREIGEEWVEKGDEKVGEKKRPRILWICTHRLIHNTITKVDKNTALSQAISYWLLKVEAKNRYQGFSRGICGNRIGGPTVVSPTA